MAATKSPWKPPFATYHGRPFSGGHADWDGVTWDVLSFTQACALQLSPQNAMLCQNQGEAERLPPPHPLLRPQAGG